MNIKKKIVEKNNKRMADRYKEINRFRYSIFKITNPAIPNEVRDNPILAKIVLDKLKELREEIKNDIDNLTIAMVDIADIFGERELDVSGLLLSEVAFVDLVEGTRKQYTNYLKGKNLEEIFPLVDRKKKAKELEKEIENLSLTIESLEEIEPKLASSQKEKKVKLQEELMALEETFDFISLEEIRPNVFVRLHGYLGNILSDIASKIAFIERNMA